MLELLRLVDLVPGEAPGIGPERDLHPRGQRAPEGLLRRLGDRVPDGVGLAAGRVDVPDDGERRGEKHLLLCHLLRGGVVDHLPVLDGVHACRQGDGVSGGSDAVRRDSPVGPVRLVHDGVQLLLREVGQAADLSVGPLVVTAVGVDLDPVRAVGDLVPHRAATGIRPVAHLDALGHVQLPAVARTSEPVGAGRGERLGGDEESRSDDDAGGHGLLHVHVGEAGALVPDVAERGEAVLERDAHRPAGSQSAIGQRLLEELLVVLDVGRVALKHHVGVGVDEARRRR